jgi:hypothetical protein
VPFIAYALLPIPLPVTVIQILSIDLRSLKHFNPWIAGGILFELAFILTIVYFPPIQHFFNTAPIAPPY